jgi:hypothetical protein
VCVWTVCLFVCLFRAEVRNGFYSQLAPRQSVSQSVSRAGASALPRVVSSEWWSAPVAPPRPVPKSKAKSKEVRYVRVGATAYVSQSVSAIDR